MKRKLIRIMYVVTPVMLVLLLALNVFTIFKVKALEESAGGEETEDVAQENDVTVGGEYVIKATTQISDAYKSGNTSNLSDKDKETLGMAKSVLDEIITDGMSDYEKELAVYKWMTANIGFDSGSMTVVPGDVASLLTIPTACSKITRPSASAMQQRSGCSCRCWASTAWSCMIRICRIHGIL